jgi:hypothetical protein
MLIEKPVPRRDDDEEAEAELEPEHLHVLQVPDELLAWVQQPEVAATMRAPLGRMAERLVKRSDRHPLSTGETETLLSLLDGVVGAAMRAGRTDLLMGLDTHTASLLNLHFEVGVGGKKVVVGPRGRWTFEEVALVQATDDPPSARDFVEKIKDLVADIFPDARVGSVGRPVPFACTGCRSEFVEGVLVELEGEMAFCRACWRERAQQEKVVAALPAPKKKRGKKKVEEEQLDLLGDEDWE